MLFFSALVFSLEILNFFRVTQFPLFNLQFTLSIVYAPTAVLAVGMASSTNSRLFLASLAAYMVCDILLSPGGLETRPVGDVTTIGLVTLGLIFVGLALAIASAVLLFSRPRVSPFVAILGGVLYFPALVADQAGLFSTLRPPLGIDALELVQALVAALVILLAFRLRRELRGLVEQSG